MPIDRSMSGERGVGRRDRPAVSAARTVNAATDFASLEAAYEAFPHILLMIGPDDRFVGFRSGRDASLIAEPEAFMGRTVAEIMPAPVAPGLVGALADVRARQQPVVHEYALTLPHGERFYEARLVPLDEGVVAALVVEVTERHERENSLRESTDRLRAILDNEPECVKVVARDGSLVEMNPAGLAMLEAGSLEEVQRRKLIDFVTEEHRAAFVDLAARVFGGERGSLAFEIVGLRGTRRWLETSAVPLRGADGTISALLGITRDITERRAAEEALRHSEQRLRTLVELATDVISLHDARGRLRFMSPSGESILGYTIAEIQDLDPIELVHPDDRPAVMGAAERLLAGETEPVRLLLRIQARDEKHRIIQVVARNLLHVPAVNAIVANWSDVTGQKRLEEQNHQLQKLEGIGRLAGGIAHDFNNVLTAILGFTALLEASLQDRPEALADLAEIRQAGERAGDLIRQLLAFARRQVLSPQTLQLNDLLEQTRRLLKPLVGEDIDLVMALDPDLWLVTVDPSQVEQVLLNLTVNARYAMPAGGRLLIETHNVVLADDHAGLDPSHPAGDHVLLVVSDTGTGIAADALPHVFEPFFTTKPDGKGTGLGLSTVYGIVKQLGGLIWVYSEVGLGTTFKIYFPRAMPATTVAAEPADWSAGRSGSETILVVEDEASVRELVSRVLAGAGYHVTVAATPAEAMSIVANLRQPPDLLLTDVVMPGMSGRALADRLCALRPSLRVLFVSGYTENTIVHHGVVERGINYLPKPFSPRLLRERVREVLDQ